MTAGELALFVEGRLEGPADRVIVGVASLRDATMEQVAFLEHPKYTSLLASSRAGVVLVGETASVPVGRAVIRVAQPSIAFGKIVEKMSPPPVRFHPGIHPKAHVDSTAKVDVTASVQPFAVIDAGAVVGARTVIGAGSYIGQEVRLGEDCLLYSHVTIRERCLVGNRVIVHVGAVIGSDGFGYEFTDNRYEKIPQVGIVQLEDDVEIGANATLDRGRFGVTLIQKGVKIDNLVQIAHNVVVGDHTAIAAQAGISGSTRIGKYVRVAGQVGTVGHITIGDGAILGAQSGVNHDVSPGKFVFGYPAQEHKEAMRMHGNILRLPQLLERVRKLEARISSLLGNKP